MKKKNYLRKIFDFMRNRNIDKKSHLMKEKRSDFDQQVVSDMKVITPISDQQVKFPVARVLSELPAVPERLVYTVTISRPENTCKLGITIVGGIGSQLGGIFIKKIFSDGIIAMDGQLKEGDELLMVNNKILRGLTHAEAVNVLSLSNTDLTMVIGRMVENKKNPGDSVSGSGKKIFTRRNQPLSIDDEPVELEYKYIRH